MSLFKAFILSTRNQSSQNPQSSLQNPLSFTIIHDQKNPWFLFPDTNQNPTFSVVSRHCLTVKPSGAETQSKGEINETVREFRNFKENPEGKKKEREKLDGKKPKKFKCLVEFVGDENKEGKMKKTMKVRRKREKVRALKGLSQLAKIFLRHLYAKGYFKEAGFVEDNELDFGYFENSYGRDFIKFAAYNFG